MFRRMLRLAAAGFCLLSLLACLTLGWLWWRSYRVRGARGFDWRAGRWEVASDRGRVSLTNGPQQRTERAPLAEAERRDAEALSQANQRRMEYSAALRQAEERYAGLRPTQRRRAV